MNPMPLIVWTDAGFMRFFLDFMVDSPAPANNFWEYKQPHYIDLVRT